MAGQIFTFRQNIFKVPPNGEHIDVIQLQEGQLTDSIMEDFILTAEGSVGVAAAFGRKCTLSALAISTPSIVLYIQMASDGKKSTDNPINRRRKIAGGRAILHDKILCNAELVKLAFHMDRLSTSLFMDHGLHIVRAVDLQSLLPKAAGRATAQTIMGVLGGEVNLLKENVLQTFMGDALSDVPNVALRAWASGMVTVVNPAAKIARTSHINTATMDQEQLQIVAKFVRDQDRLYAMKPTKVKNDVRAEFSRDNKGQLNLDLTRFKTRLREDRNQKLVIQTVRKGQQPTSSTGRVRNVEGKKALVQVHCGPTGYAKIKSVYTVGKESPTSADEERTSVILSILQGKSSLFEEPIVQKILLPPQSVVVRDGHRPRQSSPPPVAHSSPLNPSQLEAVQLIMSNYEDDRVCLIHGPPGTGKTTVIAAAVTEMLSRAGKKGKEGIWLVGQSNVAVKNIAEKLASRGFYDFRVLVSKDFHFDWHEHLYTKIEQNVIRSDSFTEDAVATSRRFLGARVILCTLSMFSHGRLMRMGITRIIPVENVIIDEASQIELGDYLPLLAKFGSNMKKMALIGDDKQLAPFGQDDLLDLRSIFELDHLRKHAVFLDTQYRMPVHIGGFISKHVYDSKLKSSHKTHHRNVVRFVDVHDGKEMKNGGSWQNDREVQVVIQIARKYHKDGKRYRIITPYDGQRNRIEQALKSAGLPWEDRCFNVDSFQGNEEDNIIISVVRSEKIGFLKNMRRTNVMLSRCKQGMMICTSRAFVAEKASATLIGKLAAECGPTSWRTTRDILAGKF